MSPSDGAPSAHARPRKCRARSCNGARASVASRCSYAPRMTFALGHLSAARSVPLGQRTRQLGASSGGQLGGASLAGQLEGQLEGKTGIVASCCGPIAHRHSRRCVAQAWATRPIHWAMDRRRGRRWARQLQARSPGRSVILTSAFALARGKRRSTHSATGQCPPSLPNQAVARGFHSRALLPFGSSTVGAVVRCTLMPLPA